LFAELFKAPEAKIATVSLEGVPLLTAFTRSPLTGWTAAAGLASTTLTAPLLRTLAITLSAGLLLLAIGLFFAVRMATRIARAEALHALLINELNHRVKNSLATVQALAMQTFSTTPDPVEARRKFDDRLIALGRAHGLLSDGNWEGADVGGIVGSVMQPYATEPGRVETNGPLILLVPAQALMLSMMLHELATNAVKYGALSNAAGRVLVEWKSADGSLWLTWRESGGPPVHEPARKGFGSRLIINGLTAQSGKAEMQFLESGLVCTIQCAIN
jgi:two-component sensor histidine kinase